MAASGFPVEFVGEGKAAPGAKPNSATIARKLILGGRVQGVGFRPFVYRLATRCGIRGWVRNNTGEVEVVAQGDAEMLQRFRQALVAEAPPLAQPKVLADDLAAPEPFVDFQIRASESSRSEHIHLPPDQFA